MKNIYNKLLRISFIKEQKRRMKLSKTFVLLVYSESVIQYGQIVSRFTYRQFILISFLLSL